MKKTNTALLIKIALLAALAAIVMTFKFPLPFAPPFYTLDFSEVIVLLAGFSLGVIPAIIVEALKILINVLINGTFTMGVGEFANFLMGCALVVPAAYIYHKHHTRKAALIGMLVGSLSITIIGSLLNYFVLLPAYSYFLKLPIDALLSQSPIQVSNVFMLIIIAVVPFNFIKGILSSAIVFVAYKKVSPVLKNKA